MAGIDYPALRREISMDTVLKRLGVTDGRRGRVGLIIVRCRMVVAVTLPSAIGRKGRSIPTSCLMNCFCREINRLDSFLL